MTLLIENFQFETILGIYVSERKNSQKIIFDGKFSYDFNGIYIDYVALKELIFSHLSEHHFGLIEDALVSLHAKIKENFDEFKEVELTIRKPDILSDCVVGATLIQKY